MSHKKTSSDFLLSKKMTKNQWLDNRLVDLAPLLVPQKFQNEAPQFYEFIQSFLMHIQRVQDSINQDKRDYLNIKEINEKDVLELYRKSYLQSLKAPDDSYDIILIKDILEVSKDFSQRKGTYFIFYLLTNILFYLIPNIKTQYQELLDQLKDPTLSQTRRESLLKQIEDFKLYNPPEKLINVVEEEKMSYSVELNYPSTLFLTHIYPFTHPSGWYANIGALIFLKFEDMFYKRDSFKVELIYQMTDHEQNRNNIVHYPDNLIHIVDVDTVKNKLQDPNRIVKIDGQNFIDNGVIHPVMPYTVNHMLIKDEDSKDDALEYTHLKYTNSNLPWKFDMDEEFYNTWVKNTKDFYKVGTNNKATVGSGLVVGGWVTVGTFLFKSEEISLKRIKVG